MEADKLKFLVFILLSCSACFAQTRLYEIDPAGIVVGWGFRNVARPGNSLVTLPISKAPPILTEDHTLATSLYRYDGSSIVVRADAELAEERGGKAAKAKAEQAVQAQMQLDAATKLADSNPDVKAFADQVSAAQSLVTSYTAEVTGTK